MYVYGQGGGGWSKIMKSEHMYFMDDPLSKGILQEKTKNSQRKKIIGK